MSDSKSSPRHDEDLPGGSPPSDRDRAIADAIANYLDSASQEEFPDVDTFCRQHPSIAQDLRPLLQSLNAMDETFSLPRGANTPEPLPPALSGHRILSEIGAGGMGRVFLALDEGLNRKVAIKTLNARFANESGIRTRFMQEARSLAQISDPHIVSIFSLGSSEEVPHFVMEYVEGTDLFHATRALTIRQRVELMRKVVLAVEVLHQHQILHRDLKPANILVGADLQPKLLDFGLALHTDSDFRLTSFGELVGTPNYFSPEQTAADQQLDARTDIFSLGTILYESLTGQLPFSERSLANQLHSIRTQDPVLPRRLNPEIPGDLQDICLKALEKKPENRYGSAREMADDLERFLAGEKVHASPTTYGNLVSGRIDEHLREIGTWRSDEALSDAEFEGFRKQYARLVEREDAWILQARRLTFPQVSLYLGAWILISGAALLFLFDFDRLSGTPRVLVASAVAALTGWQGLALWRRVLLRIYTRSSAFSLVAAIMGAAWCAITLARMGLIEWLNHDHSKLYFWLLPVAILFFAAGFLLERSKLSNDSRYFYPFAVAFSFVALSGLAADYEPLQDSLNEFLPWTRGGIEYLFIANAVIYFLLQAVLGRSSLAQMRVVARAFRFVIPGHILSSVFSLGVSAMHLWHKSQQDLSLKREARSFEILLPLLACDFIYASIPKQMKNYFVTGTLFLGIGVVRLQQDIFEDQARWSLLLLILGLLLMVAATRYSAIKMSLSRYFRRSS